MTDNRDAAAHPWDTKYMARASNWEWHNDGQVDVLADDGTPNATLTEWQTTIFHAADGNTSVGEFLSAMATAFTSRDQPAPPDLETSLLADLTYLVEELHCVDLWETKGDLASDREFPQSELPVDD